MGCFSKNFKKYYYAEWNMIYIWHLKKNRP